MLACPTQARPPSQARTVRPRSDAALSAAALRCCCCLVLLRFVLLLLVLLLVVLLLLSDMCRRDIDAGSYSTVLPASPCCAARVAISHSPTLSFMHLSPGSRAPSR